MKTATVKSRVLTGLEPRDVTITARLKQGLSYLQIEGLASETNMRETRMRVLSALAVVCDVKHWSDFTAGNAVVTVDPPAPGPAPQLDLPIAVAVLAAMGKVETVPECLFGELALDGRVRAVRGACVLATEGAVVPWDCASEAALVAPVHPVRHLRELLDWPAEEPEQVGIYPTDVKPDVSPHNPWAVLRASPKIRRALEVAAAGGHSVLLVGPPGAGKTIMARALWALLPPMTRDEAVEVTRIHSVAGLVNPDVGYVPTRPLRAPHHSVSEAGLVGGGTTPRLGEVSLAHRGVLFLDELAEFRLNTLDTLRRALAEGRVLLVNNKGLVTFPARPMLVASMNPCPCGYRGHPTRQCRCAPERVAAHWKRVEPFLSMFDIRIDVPALAFEELTASAPEVEDPRERIAAMWEWEDKLTTERDLKQAVRARENSVPIDADELAALRTSVATAYSERDRLVAALSKIFPSYLARHRASDEGWEDDWRWIVFVELPAGQASWHVHDSELAWFDHLERRGEDSGWDGHTTGEKYERLEKLPCRQRNLIECAHPSELLRAERDTIANKWVMLCGFCGAVIPDEMAAGCRRVADIDEVARDLDAAGGFARGLQHAAERIRTLETERDAAQAKLVRWHTGERDDFIRGLVEKREKAASERDQALNLARDYRAERDAAIADRKELSERLAEIERHAPSGVGGPCTRCGQTYSPATAYTPCVEAAFAALARARERIQVLEAALKLARKALSCDPVFDNHHVCLQCHDDVDGDESVRKAIDAVLEGS